MQVAIRLRPLEPPLARQQVSTPASAISVIDNTSLAIEVPPDALRGPQHAAAQRIPFRFHHVLAPAATQAEVFAATMPPLVDDLFRGINSCVLAYGQTNSGKTYAMNGGASFQSRGLIPRTLTAVFKRAREHVADGGALIVRVSYLEIYNEELYDLLGADRMTKVLVLEGPDGGVVLQNLGAHEVHSEEDALALLFSGSAARMTAATAANAKSSRSHAIFTVSVEITSAGVSRRAKVNMVDLAGSERVHRSTRVSGEGLIESAGQPLAAAQRLVLLGKEGRSINLSLHYLEQCVLALKSRGGRSSGESRNSRLAAPPRGRSYSSSASSSAPRPPVLQSHVELLKMRPRKSALQPPAAAVPAAAAQQQLPPPRPRGRSVSARSQGGGAGAARPPLVRAVSVSDVRVPAPAHTDTSRQHDVYSGEFAHSSEPLTSSVHIPYRNSALTSVLRDSLGGNCRTILLATLHPSASSVEASLATCRFAARCGGLTSARLIANESTDASVLVARLQAEVEALRTQLQSQQQQQQKQRSVSTSLTVASAAVRLSQPRNEEASHPPCGNVSSNGGTRARAEEVTHSAAEILSSRPALSGSAAVGPRVTTAGPTNDGPSLNTCALASPSSASAVAMNSPHLSRVVGWLGANVNASGASPSPRSRRVLAAASLVLHRLQPMSEAEASAAAAAAALSLRLDDAAANTAPNAAGVALEYARRAFHIAIAALSESRSAHMRDRDRLTAAHDCIAEIQAAKSRGTGIVASEHNAPMTQVKNRGGARAAASALNQPMPLICAAAAESAPLSDDLAVERGSYPPRDNAAVMGLLSPAGAAMFPVLAGLDCRAPLASVQQPRQQRSDASSQQLCVSEASVGTSKRTSEQQQQQQQQHRPGAAGSILLSSPPPPNTHQSRLSPSSPTSGSISDSISSAMHRHTEAPATGAAHEPAILSLRTSAEGSTARAPLVSATVGARAQPLDTTVAAGVASATVSKASAFEAERGGGRLHAIPSAPGISLMSMLKEGAVFLKHGRRGAPHARLVWISSSDSSSGGVHVNWRSIEHSAPVSAISSSSTAAAAAAASIIIPVDATIARGGVDGSSLPLSMWVAVVPGRRTAVFDRSRGAGRDPDDACFSIVSKTRTLDLQVLSCTRPLFGSRDSSPLPVRCTRDQWVEALQGVLRRYQQTGAVDA